MGVSRAAVEHHTWDPQSPPSYLLCSLSTMRRNGPSCWWWRPRMRSLLLVEFICLASPPWLSRYESWTSTRVQSSVPTPSPSNWRRVFLQDLCSPPSLLRIQTALWAKTSGRTVTRRLIFCKCWSGQHETHVSVFWQYQCYFFDFNIRKNTFVYIMTWRS